MVRGLLESLEYLLRPVDPLPTSRYASPVRCGDEETHLVRLRRKRALGILTVSNWFCTCLEQRRHHLRVAIVGGHGQRRVRDEHAEAQR